MAQVKTCKATRAERARQTRNRMLDSARELFIADGYAATTMERIAQEAGVAVQTLYYTFRTKGQLLCEVVEATAAGDDRAAPGSRARLGARDAGRHHGPAGTGAGGRTRRGHLRAGLAALAGRGGGVGRPRKSSSYWQRVAADRRTGQSRMVARLAELNALRHGLHPDRATDRVVVLFGHDVFTGLVTQAGWSVPEYKAWLLTTLAQQLLQRPKLTPTAYADLSYSDQLAG